MIRMNLLVLSVCLLAFTAQAQIPVDIGGLGTVGCQGAGDPPPLSNGDVATGQIVYGYDAMANELMIVVHNTTPIVGSANTAVITEVLFNLPDDVTGLALVSQTNVLGTVAPSFSLTFDAMNGCLGVFDAKLDNGNGISGGIANENASNLPGPANSMVVGPAIFVLAVSGTNLGALTTDSFAGSYSAGGTHAVQAAFKFQGSGFSDGSGKIGGAPCPGALVVDLGGACGDQPLPTMTMGLPIVNDVAHFLFETPYPFSPALIFVTDGPIQTPITLPGIPCVFHLNETSMIFQLGTDMNGDVSLMIPFGSAQAGAEYTLQARVWAPGGVLDGDHFGNGLFIRVGCP